MTVLVWLLGYSVVGILTSRWLYGQLRADHIDRLTREKLASGRLRYSTEEAIRRADNGNDASLGFALLGGFVWPLTLWLWSVQWLITRKPRASQAELAAERAALSKRVTELEKELGL